MTFKEGNIYYLSNKLLSYEKVNYSFILLPIFYLADAQSNITVSNPEAKDVLFGNYDASLYQSAVTINHHDSILQGIVNDVSADSLISYLAKIETFHNRNTGSDTVSETKGIGAVRRWIYSKLKQFSAENEDRLLVSYLDFDRTICGRLCAFRMRHLVIPTIP